ncbi:tetratricopeptide repeat protein [Coraliomargarita algicola]|uniref:Tetratricopeptide repeat protein n=1 Tax=Coraliomargarita algicola TaxID=3092156 RepID=A0ABZ0RGH3_9BACT|nr:tetratricopeptide repeat protein [Coraliomargarita sp. J2-16]WPJ95201.1 tetratricopeptide repeat protein [Coraliomargarita sp. J2-16]
MTIPTPRKRRTTRPHKLARCVSIVSAVVLLSVTGCSPETEAPSSAATTDPLEIGLSELRAFNFNQAYAILLEHSRHISPDDNDWPLATYSLALATWHQAPTTQQAIDDATVLFKSVVEKAPQDSLAASALLDLGRIAELSQSEEAAQQGQSYYQRVQDEFPGTEMAVRASLLQAQSLARSLDQSQVKQAIHILKQITQSQPNTPWRGTIEQYIAHLYAFYLDDIDEAITHYSIAKDVGFPRASDTDLSLWQLGLWQQKAKQDLAAAETFTELVEAHPRSVYGTVARKRIIEIANKHPEANIRIPELAEVRLGR